jgi:LPXTG-site transpeptidase (sortase) family protein
MKPKGTIYQKGKSGTHGEIILILPAIARLSYNLVRTFGAGLISFAILSLMFSFGPILQEELDYRLGKKSLEVVKNDFSPQIAEAERIVAVQKEALSLGVSSYFSIVIPKISASSNIIANVDASSSEEYLNALKKGVAHAKGTYFPGQSGNVFLFSHSTDSPLNFARYNAIFYLLKKLEKEDQIIVFFADKKYIYKVSEKFTAEPSDTSWLLSEAGEERLILMTCDPPGTTWKRLLVIARPVE